MTERKASPNTGLAAPHLDRAVAWVIGKALVWLGKRAYDRGDIDGYNDALAALRAGDSTCPTTPVGGALSLQFSEDSDV